MLDEPNRPLLHWQNGYLETVRPRLYPSRRRPSPNAGLDAARQHTLDTVGTIEEGMVAHLVVVNGNAPSPDATGTT